jgi:hypothetical protein
LNSLTTKEKVWLGVAFLGVFLIGTEAGKYFTLLSLKEKFRAAKDARPQSGAASGDAPTSPGAAS